MAGSLTNQARNTSTASSANIAVCIGCGCSDDLACLDNSPKDSLRRKRPCRWILVDYARMMGLCSFCVSHLHDLDYNLRKAKVAE